MNNDYLTKVFFDMSVSSDPVIWDIVKKVVKETGCELIYDWKHNNSPWEKDLTQKERSVIYENILSAMETSDIGVFDITTGSMRIGHEVTKILSKQKPTLILSNKKYRGVSNNFFQAIQNSSLYLRGYNDNLSLEIELKSFLNKHKQRIRKRLDINLDTTIYNLVAKESKRLGISKIELIRRILKD